MARYLVERSFPDGLGLSASGEGVTLYRGVVAINAGDQVTWIHSYVMQDKSKTFCIYDAPNPEAIRRVVVRNGLHVVRITEVHVLVPYFHMCARRILRCCGSQSP